MLHNTKLFFGMLCSGIMLTASSFSIYNTYKKKIANDLYIQKMDQEIYEINSRIFSSETNVETNLEILGDITYHESQDIS